VISDVYLSSGRDKQSILLLSSPPLQQTSADFSMPAEANGDAAAVPGNFDNFDRAVLQF